MLTSGEAEAQGGDYFGPTLNRAARVMSAGHGGQILVAASTIELVEEIDLIDLGPRRLRDLSEPLQLFQVRAEGLGEEFPPLKTVDAVPGNLPVQATSFIGRDAQVVELTSLVGTHRLVTLVGVGGVGKTRLALQVAAELAPTFFDGVWLVELAPLGDPASLPDVVATSLAVTPQAGLSVTESVAQALVGRNLLIVLDNCEHVLDAAAELVETILARTSTVSVVATSREALRLGGEHSWPVPSLDVRAGVASEAVSLFVERARAVNPSFRLEDPSEVDIVTEICQRLDGIALAIELAAARMVSMSAEEVRSRLNDRFRLLSGGRRGLGRHQTLRQAVQWSYDLLDDDERRVLGCCSVFADGFDLAAIAAVAGCDDEFTMLDLVDSLVRKSLVTTEQVGGRTRYGVLETIRQFAEEQLAGTGTLTDVLDASLPLLRRAGAAALGRLGRGRPAHRARLGGRRVRQPARRLPLGRRRLVTSNGRRPSPPTSPSSSGLSSGSSRWPGPRRSSRRPSPPTSRSCPGSTSPPASASTPAGPTSGWPTPTPRPRSRSTAATTRSSTAGAASSKPSPTSSAAGSSAAWRSAPSWRSERASRGWSGCADSRGRCPPSASPRRPGASADETLAAARDYGNPFWIGWALGGTGRAFAETAPLVALGALREGLAYAEEHRLPFWEANLAQDAARLEATHGEFDDALHLFSSAIDAFHRAGNIAFLAATLASLAVFFDRFERPEIAATVYGASTRQASISLVPNLPAVVDHLRSVLGDRRFDECVATGAGQSTADAVRYAYRQLRLTHREIDHVGGETDQLPPAAGAW